MAKPITQCPFTHSACAECSIYRGRHRFLTHSEQDQGSTDALKKDVLRADFQTVVSAAEPWAGKGVQAEKDLGIKLKVIDGESGTTRVSELNEAKAWDWRDPEIWRIIDNRVVFSFESLVDILRYKVEKGCREAELYENPRFAMLAGG